MVTSGSSSAWKYVNVPDGIKISVYFSKSYQIPMLTVKKRNPHFRFQEKNIILQLLLAVAVAGMTIQSSNGANLMPSASGVVNMADSHDRQAFVMVSKMKDEPMDVESIETNKEEVRVVTLLNVFCLGS